MRLRTLFMAGACANVATFFVGLCFTDPSLAIASLLALTVNLCLLGEDE